MNDLIGEAEEYRWRRGAARGAGEAGAGLAGLAGRLRAGRGRGDAGAELVSRAAAAAASLLAAFREERDASSRNASCSKEPAQRDLMLPHVRNDRVFDSLYLRPCLVDSYKSLMRLSKRAAKGFKACEALGTGGR